MRQTGLYLVAASLFATAAGVTFVRGGELTLAVGLQLAAAAAFAVLAFSRRAR